MCDNMFELFGLPPRADIPREEVEQKYVDLVKIYSAENREHEINRAFQTIAHPMMRVEHLMRLKGLSCERAQPDSDSLMEYLEVQDSIQTMEYKQLEENFKVYRNKIRDCLQKIDTHLDQKEIHRVLENVAQLRYTIRLTEIMNQKLDAFSL